METLKLIERLEHCKKYHLNPYNLGDCGETTNLIDIAIKKLKEQLKQEDNENITTAFST